MIILWLLLGIDFSLRAQKIDIDASHLPSDLVQSLPSYIRLIEIVYERAEKGISSEYEIIPFYEQRKLIENRKTDIHALKRFKYQSSSNS